MIGTILLSQANFNSSDPQIFYFPDTWRVEGLRRNCSKAAWKLLSPEVDEEKKIFAQKVMKLSREKNSFLWSVSKLGTQKKPLQI